MKENAVGWFEIPVNDMARAMKFYEAVFKVKLTNQMMGEEDMSFFPWKEGVSGAAGSLVKHEKFYWPSHKGTLVYFSSEDVNIELGRVKAAGGKILQPKKLIAPDIGYMGLFEDTEGNRLALHSRA